MILGVRRTAAPLPGLCGYAGEWSATIEFLTATHHVFALDPRGHGDSDPRPADVSRAAHVADTAAALDAIGPATVIGQSLGGHTAFLTAASPPPPRDPARPGRSRPRRARPKHPSRHRQLARQLAATLPRPSDRRTSSSAAAPSAKPGPTAYANTPTAGAPPFDRDIMVATIAAAADPRWDDFAPHHVPDSRRQGRRRIHEHQPNTRQDAGITQWSPPVEIPGAGHDVHLDSPDLWRAAVTTFLSNPCPQPEAAHPSTEISSE